MRVRLATLALSATLATAAAAQAAPVAQSFATYDLARAALGVATEVAVAQGRIGNNATGGTYEIGLHTPPGFTNGSPLGSLTERQFAWGNGTLRAFTLTRTGDSLRFRLGGYDETYTNPAVGLVDTLVIRAAATARSTLRLTQLSLNDAAPGSLALTDIAETDGDMGLVIGDIAGDFTLSGQVAMAWTGNRPSNSNLAFQIKGFDTPTSTGADPTAIPTPAALGLLGLGLVALGALRRRG